MAQIVFVRITEQKKFSVSFFTLLFQFCVCVFKLKWRGDFLTAIELMAMPFVNNITVEWNIIVRAREEAEWDFRVLNANFYEILNGKKIHLKLLSEILRIWSEQQFFRKLFHTILFLLILKNVRTKSLVKIWSQQDIRQKWFQENSLWSCWYFE